jgi:hypothetical protein
MNMMNPPSFDLSRHGLAVTHVYHNLPPRVLYEHAICFEKDASIAAKKLASLEQERRDVCPRRKRRRKSRGPSV